MTRVAGDPDHPSTHGALCTKVSRYAERTYSPDRLLQPMRRTGPKGSGRFEPVSWEAALDEVATRATTVVPPDADVDDLDPLTAPVDEEFRVAAMGLAWDGDAEAVVVEAVAAGEEPIEEDAILSDSDEGPDALRVTITPAAARSFIAREKFPMTSPGRARFSSATSVRMPMAAPAPPRPRATSM